MACCKVLITAMAHALALIIITLPYLVKHKKVGETRDLLSFGSNLDDLIPIRLDRLAIDEFIKLHPAMKIVREVKLALPGGANPWGAL